MAETLAEAVLSALRAVKDPATGQDVVAAGMVQGLAAREGMVQFSLQVPRERAAQLEPLRLAAQKAANSAAGDPQGESNNTLTAANIVWMVVGVLLWLLVLLGLYVAMVGEEALQ